MSLFEHYQQKGHCIIRGVFSPQDTLLIRKCAAEIYRHIFGTDQPKSGANTLHLSDIVKQQIPWMEKFIFWIFGTFVRSEAYQIYERLYGNYVAFPLLKCIFRYQRPDHINSFLPYHQDADGTRVEHHIVNCWTALDECGAHAPGIELINCPLHELHSDLFVYETLDKVGPDLLQKKLDDVMSRFGCYGITRPIFQPGDGIIFDHLVMHRTYFNPDMIRPRMSLEIRASHPDVLMKGYGEVDRITVRRDGPDAFEFYYCRPFTPAFNSPDISSVEIASHIPKSSKLSFLDRIKAFRG